MTVESIIKKSLKKLKERFGMKTELLERELIPLQPGDVQPRLLKKRKKS